MVQIQNLENIWKTSALGVLGYILPKRYDAESVVDFIAHIFNCGTKNSV